MPINIQVNSALRSSSKLASVQEELLPVSLGKGKRKKKLQGGNPSKRHRDRLNTELDNLARLLPFPEDTISKLDKISILRLTVSYLKAKSYFQVYSSRKKNSKSNASQKDGTAALCEGNGFMSQLMLEALDGFIMIIMTDGQLFYVSESVKDFLGYSQASLIHQSLFKFLHVDDHNCVKENLTTNCGTFKQAANGSSGFVENGDIGKVDKNFSCRIKCTLTHGGGFYKMFQCRGKMREVRIKKRDSVNVEYGLFAVISPVMNNLPSASTLEMVRKEAILASQRRFQLDQNMNITGQYTPGATAQYNDFLSQNPLMMPRTPGSNEPPTPNDAPMRPSFFPTSFTYRNNEHNQLKSKRLSSCSSGVNDDSSTNDENASSEGSCDDNTSAQRIRIPFSYDHDGSMADPEKSAKINQRRMSTASFPTTPQTPTTYDSPFAMFNSGPGNWLIPSPLPSPLASPLYSYQDLMQRMDTRPMMSPGLLSPFIPPFSPGGMYAPFSPNPFLMRNGSLSNMDPPLGLAGLGGMMGDNTRLVSPAMRPPTATYDPFNYFMTSPLGARRMTTDSTVSCEKEPSNGGGESSEGPQANTEEDVDVDVTEDSDTNASERLPRPPNTQASSPLPHKPSPDPVPKEARSDAKQNERHDEEAPCPEIKDGAKKRSQKKTKSVNRANHRNTATSKNDEIQETLADIAESFTSKLDSIKSRFTLSMDRNVASCIGKKERIRTT